MACYYIIKLPNGGEVKILATISTITEQDNKDLFDKLSRQIRKYYSDPNPEELSGESEIIKFLKGAGTGLDTKALKEIINISDKNSFISNLNERILKNLEDKAIKKLSNEDLADSLRRLLWDTKRKIIYTNSEGNSSNIGLPILLKKLSSPISKKYFNVIQTNNILGVRKLPDITTDLETNIDALDSIGANSSIIGSLKNILNKAFYTKNRADKMFYNIGFSADVNDAVVVFPEESQNPIIFYNGLNDMSLFTGAFKYLGSKISLEQLLPILQEYNESLKSKDGTLSENALDLTNIDVVSFFTGSFKEDKNKIEFVDPEVNKLFRFKINAQKAIDKITDLIVNNLSESDKTRITLKDDFNRLFRFIDPEKYGKGINAEEQLLLQAYNIEQTRNKQLTNEIKGRALLPMIASEKRDFHYSRPIKVPGLNTSEEIFAYLNANVSKNRDLLNVTTINRDKTTFVRSIVPTEFHIISGGVKVVGFYSDLGDLKWTQGFIFNAEKGKEEESTISHRELLDEIPIIYTKDAEKIPTENSIVIVAPEGEFLPKELVQSSIVRGGTIFYKPEKPKKTKKGSEREEFIQAAIVKGVYPGTLRGNSYVRGKEVIEPNLSISRVTSIVTENIFEDEFTESDDKIAILENLYRVDSTKEFVPVSKGDYVRTVGERNGKPVNLYNKVIAVFEDSSYILIKVKGKDKEPDKYVIKAIPNNTIQTIYKPKINFDIQDVKNVGSFHRQVNEDRSISSSNFSSIESYEYAKNGDYAVTYNAEDENYTIYKITNKDKREGIKLVLNGDKLMKQVYTSIPLELDNFSIITTRNIYSEYAIGTAEKNNVFLTTEFNPESGIRYEEVKYFIPENSNIKNLTVLDSGNVITGIFRTSDYLDEIPPNYKEATKELVDYLNEKRKVKGDKLYIKVRGQGKKYYVRYNAALYQTDFSKDPDNKDKYLKEHTFIVLFKDNKSGTSGSKTYRILGRSENIITIEYSTFNLDGKLVSIQKQLDLSKDRDKIKWLYVMKGSNAHKEMDTQLKEAAVIEEKKKTDAEILQERKDIINSIASSFKNIFNIDTVSEEVLDEEYANKKAWIEISTKGAPRIVVNVANKRADTQDVVHEYLHLFLMALKYNNIGDSVNAYEQILHSYKESFIGKTGTTKKENDKIEFLTKSTDWTKIEEFFVEDISKKIDSDDIDTIVDYKTFLAGFNKAIDNLQLSSPTFDDTNIFSLLNSKMVEIFPRVNGKLSNSGLMLFDANFRKWLSGQINNSEIEVLC